VRPYGAVLLIGLPRAAEAHAETATILALGLLRRVPGCAAGLHTGAVTGGVIGATRPHYDVWGEAVETAAARRHLPALGSGRLHCRPQSRGQEARPDPLCHPLLSMPRLTLMRSLCIFCVWVHGRFR
jgi:hypothetical protein